eukprot:9253453-Pyramimonas_sp.AAC.1
MAKSGREPCPDTGSRILSPSSMSWWKMPSWCAALSTPLVGAEVTCADHWSGSRLAYGAVAAAACGRAA